MSVQLDPQAPGFWYPELQVHVPPLQAPFPHEHEAQGSIGVQPPPEQFGDPVYPESQTQLAPEHELNGPQLQVI